MPAGKIWSPMQSKKSYVQVYTGDGKGKTTAAIGLTVRALGADKKVAFIQFMKAVGYSEHNIMKTLSPDLMHLTVGKPFFVAKEGSLSDDDLKKISVQCEVFPPGRPPADYVELIREGMVKAREAVSGGAFDLVVLDEINCALFFELVGWSDVAELIDGRHPRTELVLTGRGAPQALLDKADLVTEMKEIKHYYNCGILARRGIEN